MNKTVIHFPKIEIELLRKAQMEKIMKMKCSVTQKESSEGSFTGRKETGKAEFQTLKIPQN